jgi:hypothetical protein
MATTAFKLVGDWKKLQKAFDPRVFQAKNKKHIERATKINGLLAVRTARETMADPSLYKENAPLTIAIKGSTKPLIDDGDLRKAITHKVVDTFTVFVGVLRTHAFSNIAEKLHEGVVIPVSRKMRNMFRLLWLKYQLSLRGKESELKLTGRAEDLWEDYKGPWYRIRKPNIVIKARRFFKFAFENPELLKKVEENWILAIARTLRELAR